ncbi:oligoendopeptidase F [Lactobacillus sp. PV037]|uniref:oligoendopeptidase F n=1 Tax=Lactobacillus sp. PV037 TaxID=2594496 RepID=UPI00223EB9E0|nr:oligoendopeptidase F [Lactobacillus sp. PV037]QNQ83086.1 oligoendopeptidase F [Lactobacillus sp. PV037]
MVLPTRNEVSDSLKWDLSRIFKNDQEWEEEFKNISQKIAKIPTYSQNFTQSATNLYNGLTAITSIERQLEKLYSYATLSSDADTTNTHYLGYVAQVQDLVTKMNANSAFVDPAILEIDEKTLTQFIEDDPRLELFTHKFEELTKKRPHTLSADKEKIIADASSALNSSANTFNILTNSDIEYGFTQDDSGEMVQLSEGIYSTLIQSANRSVRKNAFTTLYDSYAQFNNTLASTLAGNVKMQNYQAQVHNYNSAKEASLAANNIPNIVYDTLIKQVNEHLPLFHRYIALRKKILSLPDLQMYDMYVPLTGKPALSYNFEEAKIEAKKALAILGDDYLKQVDYIFNNRVIDPIESKGKVTGAYSGGSYDTDAYELLNWTNDVDSLYTLVHETGHSVHSMYTRQTQPYIYGDYPIFVAEIASTTNENLLTEYFLENIQDPKTRAFVLNYYLDAVKGTLFRQTQFAEFEQFIHEADSQGIPLTAETLNNAYSNLNSRYYGKDVEPGGDIAMEWSRIPHFYYNFYVYQYATGFAAASALADGIMHGDSTQRDKYLEFLKAGSSDYPVNLVKKAGVDMTKPDYLENTFNTFEKRLNELENLTNTL